LGASQLFENDSAFWNAGKNAKNLALWNHLESPLRQMDNTN
jgi:hypothetical protein